MLRALFSSANPFVSKCGKLRRRCIAGLGANNSLFIGYLFQQSTALEEVIIYTLESRSDDFPTISAASLWRVVKIAVSGAPKCGTTKRRLAVPRTTNAQNYKFDNFRCKPLARRKDRGERRLTLSCPDVRFRGTIGHRKVTLKSVENDPKATSPLSKWSGRFPGLRVLVSVTLPSENWEGRGSAAVHAREEPVMKATTLFSTTAFLLIACVPAGAQQTTGVPGSPDATTTIDGRYLPPPPQQFEGEIDLNAAQSKSAWPARMVPPKGAPNILLILTDDVGFGAPSTFGGVIPTPTMDRIAANGLRYTNFHSTSLCSPTRAALITGRNHHSVGFGVISEIATGFPGYNSVIGKDSATIGRILLENGYRTSWFGKNHNTPVYQTSQAGPFDQWPTGMGFEYFYGFMGGDADQWTPGSLFRNTTHIEPFIGNPSWNLITAMADDAIHWMNELNDINPDMPFLLYYVPGGTHSPHHPTPEWVKKISDMHLFDDGWNAVRDQIFANQKRLGVIPQDAKLTPWPKDMLKEWDQLTPVEKKLFIRQADVYGAYLAYTDHEIGRVIQAVEDMGKLDNTLIIYISGDNGCFGRRLAHRHAERSHSVQRH